MSQNAKCQIFVKQSTRVKSYIKEKLTSPYLKRTRSMTDVSYLVMTPIEND